MNAAAGESDGISAIELTIAPAPGEWGSLMASRSGAEAEVFGRPWREWIEQSRRELGLPVDRTIVATGHAPILFHPGILAKYIAITAYARRTGAATMNLVIDHHADAFAAFDVPIRREDGSLGTRHITLMEHVEGVPMSRLPGVAPADDHGRAGDEALPEIAAGIGRMKDAMRAHRGKPNAAARMTAVLHELMSPVLRGETPSAPAMCDVNATASLDAGFARRLLAWLGENAREAAMAYNRAAAAHPEARIQALSIERDRVEVPCWRIGEDRTLVRAFDADLREVTATGAEPSSLLAPRALLTTALARLVACDLFIHGAGGMRYDEAMEQWIQECLGVMPAPKALVTATVRLPLGVAQADDRDLAAARRSARQLHHDPFMTLDGAAGGRTSGGPSAVKAKLIAEIAALPRNSVERRRRYREFHERLEAERASRTGELHAAREHVDATVRRVQDWSVAGRRDWPFPLYPAAVLDRLAMEIAGRFD